LKKLSKQLGRAAEPQVIPADGRNGHARKPRSGIESTARRLARELGAWPALTAQNIHEFRLAVKQLRYVLQLIASVDEDFLAALGRTQRRIGEWHDWQQLEEIAIEALDQKKDRELLLRLGAVVRENLSRALATAKELRRRYLHAPVTNIQGC
jgi:CHAD domain-containing protein